MNVKGLGPLASIQNPKSKIQNELGGGVWGSNPPKHALAYSLTVLKTAPITGQDAPPEFCGIDLLAVSHHYLRLTSHAVAKMTALGIQIQMNSLAITPIPRSLKKPKPIGDTSIGRHGKKNLSLLNGASNATPRPPLVNISRNGCVAVTKPKYRASFHFGI